MLSLEQDRAAQILKTRIKNPISILQGAAGTGKSYLLSHFLESLNYNSDDIAFVTFTGTAAKILQKQNLPATTIHKLIYKPIIVGGICIGFTRLSKADVGHLKLIIVDEFSMVSQDILDDLMSYKIPLLLVGDQAQLPPIGTPNKYINSADAILTEVHRQALDNPILWAATQIRLGNGLPNGIYGNKLWVGNKKDMDPNWIRPDVQIITGLNATKDKYNLELAGTPRPMENHRIMFLKNDWTLGITNGTIGTIDRITGSFNNKILDFQADDRKYKKYPAIFLLSGPTPQQRGQYFSYAYAISCHKAQGQTFDQSGLIFDESSSFRENSRKWLYTAVSRWTGNYPVALIR